MEFVNEIFVNLLTEDGLLVLARGLGLDLIVRKFLQLYCDPSNLVLVMGSNAAEEEYFVDELLVQGVPLPQLPKQVTNEVSAKERESLYLKGGVLFVTSRILVVDLLKKTCPVDKVAGLIVLHAERVTDESCETFILQLFRQDNKVGFIKAFSDVPEMLTGQFGKVERLMRNMFLRNLLIFPRFHASVVASLSQHQPEVVELREQMSPSMCSIQVAILDVMKACINELHQCNPSIDKDLFVMENCLTKSFDVAVRLQLDPVWNQLGKKTKQLVFDLKTMRSMLYYLIQYDSVTFYYFVERLRNGEALGRNFSDHSGWLFTDAANTLFTQARCRVFENQNLGKGKGKKKKTCSAKGETDTVEGDLILEEPPKWKLLQQILEEVSQSVKDSAESECVRTLVVANDERTCYQLKEFIVSGNGRELLLRTFRRLCGPVTSSDGCHGSKTSGYHNKKTRKRPNQKQTLSKHAKKKKLIEENSNEESAQERIKSSNDDNERQSNMEPLNINEDYNCLMEEEDETSDEFDPKLLDSAHGVLGPEVVIFYPLKSNSHNYGFSRALSDNQPRYVVLYDADVACIRQLEVYKAQNVGVPLRVYVMFYDSSVEEQRYLTALYKEKDSFHSLIKTKSTMVIPQEQDGKTVSPTHLIRGSSSIMADAVDTRKAGGREASIEQQILVDMREFRSALPSLIHRSGTNVVPLTLQVGDYILTPDICVERKSLNDLISSLNSGRLYNQATAMMRFYRKPLLLIEFSNHQSFSLQPKSAYTGELSLQNISSKLVLFTLHFPKVQIVWTRSPHATAELFMEFKKGKPQPDEETAVQVGVGAGAPQISSSFSSAPMDFLLKCPGISTKNCKTLMAKVNSLSAMVALSVEEIEEILQNKTNASLLWSFIHSNY